MSFCQLFNTTARRFPDKVALKDCDEEITYYQLANMSRKLGSFLLNKGFQKGDRVAILFENSVQYVVSYLGILNSGLIAVPINTDNSKENIQYILADCSVKGVIGEEKFLKKYDVLHDSGQKRFFLVYSQNALSLEGCHDWNDVLNSQASQTNQINELKIEESDLACIVYTSGTTGNPKGVMLTHKNIVSNTCSIISYLHLSHNDSVLVVLPFYYSYGSSLLHTHLAVGGTLVLEKQFVYPNLALKKLSKEKVTGFAGVPSTYALLLNRSNFVKMDWPNLRYVTQAGGPMAPALIEQLSDSLPDTEIFVMYGQTEATARLSYLEPSLLKEKIGSVGKAIPGVKLGVIRENGTLVDPGEVGEIVAQGPNIMKGYWKNDEETKKVLRDGWLHTGDLARIDEDGFIYIVGRKTEMIKSGAHRISPKEIEDVLLDFKNIVEAAVVGVPDDVLGERIVAFLVLDNGRILDSQKILRFCRRKLPSFKIPHEIKVVDSLPKTSSGKVKKFLLKEDPQFKSVGIS